MASNEVSSTKDGLTVGKPKCRDVLYSETRNSVEEENTMMENEKPDFAVYANATSTPLTKPKTKFRGSDSKTQGSISSVSRNKSNRSRVVKNSFTVHQKHYQVGECSGKESDIGRDSGRVHSYDGKPPNNNEGKVETDEPSTTENCDSTEADGAQAVHTPLRRGGSPYCICYPYGHRRATTSKTVQTEQNTTESSSGSASEDNSDLHARFSSARESLSELMRKCSSDGRNLSRSRPANSYREMMRQHHETGSRDDHHLWPDDGVDPTADIPAPQQVILNGGDIEDILEFLHLHDTDTDRDHQEQVLPYLVGEPRFTTCQICLDVKMLHLRFCCDYPACDNCLSQYCTVQVQQAVVKIPCIGLDCQEFMHRDEVSARLAGSMKERFYKFLVDANKDPNTKTCPQCSHVTTYEPQILKNPKVKKKKVPTATLR